MNNKINKIFKQYPKDFILITNPKDIFYLTGAEFEGFWLLLAKKKLFAITSQMIKGQIETEFKNKIKIVTDTSFIKALVAIIKQYNVNRLLVDTTELLVSTFTLIEKILKLSNITVKQINSVTNNLRIIKNKDEINNIKTACELVSKIFETVKNKIICGMKEIDIHFLIEQEFAKHHTVASFKTIVASGPNAANPHHISGERKIKKNDIVLIDMGCICNGYCSDLTRTFFVGKPTRYQQKIWNTVKQAHDEAMEKIKPNIKACDIDLTARNIIKADGFEKYFIHTTGHGVGIDIHEAPAISHKNEAFLKEGMVITIEPGIYLKNKFGVRIEDTVLVTKTGFKKLTNAKYFF